MNWSYLNGKSRQITGMGSLISLLFLRVEYLHWRRVCKKELGMLSLAAPVLLFLEPARPRGQWLPSPELDRSYKNNI